MGWHDEDWSYRRIITVDNSGGAAAADVEIVVPIDDDHFWTNILATGADIRITTADGQTLAAYALSGYVFATRTLTIQVDAVTLSGVAGMDALFLYYGNASAVSAAVAVVIAAARTGYIDLGAPSTHQFEARPETPGSTRPRARVQKTADEQVYVWFRVDRMLEKRSQTYQKHRQWEEVRSAVVTVTLATVAQAAMVTAARQRFVERRGPDGVLQVWIRAFIQAGTTATNYTLEADIRTVVPANTVHRLIEPRALLSVQTVSEV